jgi:peptide/nickel transport system ATP-binding protein
MAEALSAAVDDPARRPPLLEVEELVTRVRSEAGERSVVDGVSFTVGAGETVALVGESGCGKSMTALSILRLVPEPAARVASGAVRLRGRDLLALDPSELRRVRGREVAIVFQEPMSALNPVLRVGEQVAEAIRLETDRETARRRALTLLARVGIPEPELRYRAFPHQLSGGMRQRVLIALALARDPALLIADEPTTALDLTLQAQIVALLASLQRERGMGLLLITHDLALARESARLVVLYAGQVVESGPTAGLLASPRHPYTAALLDAARALSHGAPGSAAPLPELPGTVPDPSRGWPAGCRFAARCGRADDVCRAALPPLERRDARELRCLHPLEDPDGAGR